MSILDIINNRIRKEMCSTTERLLSDNGLLDDFAIKPSTKKKIDKLNAILIEEGIQDDKRSNIIEKFKQDLIPAGTKGQTRGIKFNKIVEDRLKQLLDKNYNKEDYELQFEKICPSCPTDEKPDWYIHYKPINKIIIGMNQIDLWSGGQQLNRGSKYIFNQKDILNNPNAKLVCVVCKSTEFKSTKSKKFKLFEDGYKNNTLCYINGLEDLIKHFFSV
jgi:hypothetical protein